MVIVSSARSTASRAARAVAMAPKASSKLAITSVSLYWTEPATDRSHSQADHLVLSAFDLAG